MTGERRGHHLTALQAHFIAATGEFVGTFMFLYFSFGAQIMLHTQSGDDLLPNGQLSSQLNILTALVYGFSLLVNVWAFYRISGGLFNPAVCVSLHTPGALTKESANR
jgi:aquaporin related protein